MKKTSYPLCLVFEYGITKNYNNCTFTIIDKELVDFENIKQCNWITKDGIIYYPKYDMIFYPDMETGYNVYCSLTQNKKETFVKKGFKNKKTYFYLNVKDVIIKPNEKLYKIGVSPIMIYDIKFYRDKNKPNMIYTYNMDNVFLREYN